MRLVLFVVCFSLLSGCAATKAFFAKFKKEHVEEQQVEIVEQKDPSALPLLIGYKSVVLRDSIIPEATIVFDLNSAELKPHHEQELLKLIDMERVYVIEGTAGGMKHAGLSNNRALNIASFLTDAGVSTENIYIAEYDPRKEGRRGFVYTLITE